MNGVINLAGATVDERPDLGFVQISVSREAQVKALLEGKTLSKDWKIGIHSAEAAKLALDLGADIHSSGSLELDAKKDPLDALPDLRDAAEALQAVKMKMDEKKGKEDMGRTREGYAYKSKPGDPIQIDHEEEEVGGIEIGGDLHGYAVFEAAAFLASNWNTYPKEQVLQHVAQDIDEVCLRLKAWGRELVAGRCSLDVTREGD